MKKIALVTGTSSGIGLSTALALAKAGFTVVATMRNLDKAGALQQAAQAQGLALELQQMDVQDQASVSACVQRVIQTHGQIDVLVNNAGSGFLGAMEETGIGDLQQVMDVNFYGVWRVTQAVFPHMRAAGAGRILSVSSVGGLIGQPFNDAYCAAKFAVEGFMESLAPVAQRFGIKIALIEPGPVHSEFVASVQEKVHSQANQLEAYAAMRAAYLEGAAQAFASIGQSPDQIAQLIVDAATTAGMHLRYPSSEVMRGLISRKYVDPNGDSILSLNGARLPATCGG
ncbi:MAG: SDR family oxidoreductase [Burkholderiales bacterium]|nr:SDR family oxidoreductase [Burkholderiales bacterium]